MLNWAKLSTKEIMKQFLIINTNKNVVQLSFKNLIWYWLNSEQKKKKVIELGAKRAFTKIGISSALLRRTADKKNLTVAKCNCMLPVIYHWCRILRARENIHIIHAFTAMARIASTILIKVTKYTTLFSIYVTTIYHCCYATNI